jgi:hypothetical protein
MIFVNSMSDLFHKAVPKGHIAKVFDTMEQADWHIYQVLTKRSSLLQKFINERYRGPAGAGAYVVRRLDRKRASDLAHRSPAKSQRPHRGDPAGPVELAPAVPTSSAAGSQRPPTASQVRI